MNEVNLIDDEMRQRIENTPPTPREILDRIDATLTVLVDRTERIEARLGELQSKADAAQSELDRVKANLPPWLRKLTGQA